MGDEGHLRARSDGQRATRGHNAELVTAEDVRWLVAHLRVVVTAGSAVWVGRRMTLRQLTVLVTLTDLAQVLSTRPRRPPSRSSIG